MLWFTFFNFEAQLVNFWVELVNFPATLVLWSVHRVTRRPNLGIQDREELNPTPETLTGAGDKGVEVPPGGLEEAIHDPQASTPYP